MACNENINLKTYPLSIVAKTTNKSFTAVSGMTPGILIDVIKDVLRRAGWGVLGGGFFQTAGQEETNVDFVGAEWYQPRVNLSMQAGPGIINFEVSHTNNAYAPSTGLRMNVGSEYLVFADLYSLHVVCRDSNPRAKSFSMCNLHINCTVRTKYRVSSNVYATINHAFIETGGSDNFGDTCFHGCKNETFGNFSFTGQGRGSVRTVGIRTAIGKTLSYDLPNQSYSAWLASPVYVGWGENRIARPKLRGFLWNMLYFYGTFEKDTVINYRGLFYYVIANHAGCSLTWRLR